MSWTLANAEDRWGQTPGAMPPKQDREAILRDYKVKLIFNQEDPRVAGERMWVVVTKVDGDKYQGTLVNTPASIEDLKHGDLIDFGPEHIVDIIRL